jgi:hypothetical protein
VATTLDLLDRALGGDVTARRVERLTDAEIDALAEAVADASEHWEAPEPDQEFRVYSGGWVAKPYGEALSQLFTSLLYAPSVVVHDPIAEWFDPHRGRFDSLPGIPSGQRNLDGRPSMVVVGGEPIQFNATGFYRREGDRYDATREELARSVPALAGVAPLIRSGVMVLVPELTLVWRHQRQLLDATRFDTRDAELGELISRLNVAGDPPPWSNLVRGALVTPSSGVARGHELQHLVQGPAYFFHKTMAIASDLNADYVPLAGADSALLMYRLHQLGKRLDTQTNHNVTLKLLPGLASAELPFLQELDPRLLLAIREDEGAFADWRAELRDTVRVIRSLPSDGQEFEAEARDVLNERLMPRAREVQKAVSLSQAMRDATRESLGTFAVSAAAAGYGSLAIGSTEAWHVAIVAGIATPLQWLWRVAFRPSPTGANAVLTELVQRR